MRGASFRDRLALSGSSAKVFRAEATGSAKIVFREAWPVLEGDPNRIPFPLIRVAVGYAGSMGFAWSVRGEVFSISAPPRRLRKTASRARWPGRLRGFRICVSLTFGPALSGFEGFRLSVDSASRLARKPDHERMRADG